MVSLTEWNCFYNPADCLAEECTKLFRWAINTLWGPHRTDRNGAPVRTLPTKRFGFTFHISRFTHDNVKQTENRLYGTKLLLYLLFCD